MKRHRDLCWIAIAPTAFLVVLVGLALAGPCQVPVSFQPNTVADANEVNANFAAVANAIDDNDARLSATEGAISSHAARLTALEGAILPQAVVYVAYRSVMPPTIPYTIASAVNHLPGGATPTVSSPAAGVFDVDLGTDVTGRYLQVTLGASTSRSSTLVFHQVEFRGTVAAEVLSDQNTRVRVHIQDENGSGVGSSFFLTIW